MIGLDREQQIERAASDRLELLEGIHHFRAVDLDRDPAGGIGLDRLHVLLNHQRGTWITIVKGVQQAQFGLGECRSHAARADDSGEQQRSNRPSLAAAM